MNTLVRRPDGTLHGDNTDDAGFTAMVEESGVYPAGKTCVVLGSGGASRTVVAVLKRMGAKRVVVVSRRGEDHYGNLACHADAALLVNATPVGMYLGRRRESRRGLVGLPEVGGRAGSHLQPAQDEDFWPTPRSAGSGR